MWNNSDRNVAVRSGPRWGLLFRSALAAAAMALLISAHASPYLEIRLSVVQTNFGRITLDAHTTNAVSSTLVNQWTARCMVGRGNWLIEDTYVPGILNTYFFDGTNVLQTSEITRIVELPEELKRLRPPRLGSDSAHGPSQSDWIFLTISPEEVPLDNLGSQLSWLALCSGQYLRKPGRLLPLPTALTRAYAGAFGFKDNTDTFSDELGLPRSVGMLASAKLSAMAVKHESLFRTGRSSAAIRNSISPHANFPEGFLKASYRVLTHTNFGGWIIPTSFTYEDFAPAAGGGATPILIAAGAVDSIKGSIEPTFTLSPTVRYSVADYRFRHPSKTVDQIHYAITNGQVQPTTDPALRRMFERQVAAAPFDPVIKVHYGIYVVFMALLAGPVIAAAVFRLRRKRSMKAD